MPQEEVTTICLARSILDATGPAGGRAPGQEFVDNTLNIVQYILKGGHSAPCNTKEDPMKRVCKLAGIVSKPLQRRYLQSTPEEQAELRSTIESESRWMIDKMSRKGYRLEAIVAGVYGLFTRGEASGRVELVDRVEKSTA